MYGAEIITRMVAVYTIHFFAVCMLGHAIQIYSDNSFLSTFPSKQIWLRSSLHMANSWSHPANRASSWTNLAQILQPLIFMVAKTIAGATTNCNPLCKLWLWCILDFGAIHLASETDFFSRTTQDNFKLYPTSILFKTILMHARHTTPFHCASHPCLQLFNWAPTGQQWQRGAISAAKTFFEIKKCTVCPSWYKHNNDDLKPSDCCSLEIDDDYSCWSKKLDMLFALDVLGEANNVIVGLFKWLKAYSIGDRWYQSVLVCSERSKVTLTNCGWMSWSGSGCRRWWNEQSLLVNSDQKGGTRWHYRSCDNSSNKQSGLQSCKAMIKTNFDTYIFERVQLRGS